MSHRRKAFQQSKPWLLLLGLLLVVSIAHSRPLTRAEIGELFIFGIPNAVLTPKIQEHLKTLCPGSVLLFRRNLVNNQQTALMTQQLRKLHRECSRSEMFIGLDQEGGQVARIPFDPPMPSPWAVGATKKTELAESLGYEVGLTLRRLGFNLNLAPVLDLGDGSQKTFIGSRSFGSDPALVGAMGAAMSLGFVKARVLPVAKHFPGIGPVPNDPHQVMVRRSASSEELWAKDIQPFKAYAQIVPSAIMPSHLIYRLENESPGPGTFSKTLLIDWLRKKINFTGLVISDDLLMRGAQESKDIGQNVVSALKSGVDLVMVSWSLKSQIRAVQAVTESLRSGELTQELLREKIIRIRKVKKMIGDPPYLEDPQNQHLRLVGSLNYSDVAFQVMNRNLQPQMTKVIREKPKRIFLWTRDLRIRWQIERALNLPVLTASSPEFRKLKKTDTILAFIKTKKEAQQLAAWSSKLKSRTIVVNQVEAGLFDAHFQTEIQVYLDHPMLGTEVAKGLASRWGRTFISRDFR